MRTLLSFLDTLLPGGCAACGTAVPADGPPLCGLCAARLEEIPPPRCSRCGLTKLADMGSAGGCGACAGWPGHLRTASACLHTGHAVRLVHGFKYHGWTGLAPPMADLMWPAARRLAAGASPTLVPVPLTAARLRERGFNQAELLARELSRSAGWPVRCLLDRSDGGPSFARLGREQRARRAAEAFRVVRGPDRSCTDRVPTLLVDDVITTGATAGACIQELMASGWSCLGAVSFARTSPGLDGP